MTLVDLLALKVPGRVQGFAPGCEHVVALMELGFVPGTRVSVIRQAPLGCPLEVDVTGARLAIRRGVAETVLVELEPSEPAARADEGARPAAKEAA